MPRPCWPRTGCCRKSSSNSACRSRSKRGYAGGTALDNGRLLDPIGREAQGRRWRAPSPWKLREAARIIRNGGVLAYPTEAVYGLGCDPMQPTAVRRLLAFKRRSPRKGLILIAARFEQLRGLVADPGPDLLRLVLASWPGPVTWLLPAGIAASPWVRGEHASVAVRVTAHPVAAELCEAVGGPLVSTSANRAGGAAARSALGVYRWFGRTLDGVLVGATGGQRHPTEIRDGLTRAVIRSSG